MSSNLKIFALGGLHEVGKNCYVFEKDEDIIIVDCGVKFLNGSNLADGTVPNFSYLVANQKKIKGLFVTHGHEDHIGGISYLLQLIPNIPVYGSEFSISLLKQKLRGESKEKSTIFQDDTIIRTGEFRVIKLAEIGKKGVDLLLSDSTNSEVEGNTPSEAKVVKRLENIITEATGRVIITSFASNVYRLKKVIEIAQKTDKKIVLLGSSLLKMMKAIQKAMEAGDCIILTSSPIMDNKFNVELISNKLFALGAKVYENNKEDLLHASGHACQEDLKLMLTLTKPRYFMPFHGDFRMLKKHGHLAQELGIQKENIFVCANGEVVETRGKEFFLTKKKIPAQPNYVFNGRILPAEELKNNLILREKMSQGELKDFSQVVNQAETELQNIQKEIGGLNETIEELNAIEKELKNVTANLAELNKTGKELERTGENIKGSLDDLGEIKEKIDELVKLEIPLAELEKTIDREGGEIAKALKEKIGELFKDGKLIITGQLETVKYSQ
ncbi:1144_t:CDS:2 [Racocetra fulgida]|uniref:1144_t:CDS:1 n=1 Tax=Racocetra fulgida TaxID=60492 RepID=A0A9N8YSS8_9GLOM|nr:1144_t:CDS:2 [Racocetra fulgida]